MNILLIEDDKLMRSGLSSVLLDWGYTVSAVSNGQEALDFVAKNNQVDLIICDIFMPVLSGPSFLLQLKKYFQGQFPKVLIMSSVKNPDEFFKSIDVKHDAFLSKPLDFNQLKNVLTNLFSAKKI